MSSKRGGRPSGSGPMDVWDTEGLEHLNHVLREAVLTAEEMFWTAKGSQTETLETAVKRSKAFKERLVHGNKAS